MQKVAQVTVIPSSLKGLVESKRISKREKQNILIRDISYLVHRRGACGLHCVGPTVQTTQNKRI